MKFIPKKSKYKKQFKGALTNQLSKNICSNKIFVGKIGLKAIESGILNSSQFEAIRQSIKKIIKKAGRLIFVIFPHVPKTKKPLEIRMGKGKGSVDHWISKVQMGTILCEINTSNKALAIKALYTAKFRLPLKTKLIVEN